MGRQIRFYMLPNDEQEFLDFVFLKPGIKLIKEVSDTPELIISRTDLNKMPTIRQVCIWDSNFELDMSKFKKKHYQEYDDELGIYTESDRVYYSFARSSDDPIIEYDRSFIRDDGKLTEGRVWADMYRIEGNIFVKKNPKFIAWFDEIARWLRRNLKRNRDLNAYVSQRVLDWWEIGGCLH
jgi:hypothetical protein